MRVINYSKATSKGATLEMSALGEALNLLEDLENNSYNSHYISSILCEISELIEIRTHLLIQKDLDVPAILFETINQNDSAVFVL